MIESVNRKAIMGIEKSLEQIETLITKTIEEDPQLNQKLKLALSVKGKVLGVELILATHGFTRMMNCRKLACHVGVAPFDFQSDSSLMSQG